MAALLGDIPAQHGAQEEDVDDLIPHDPEPTTTSALPTYKSDFLQSCLSASVLTFGNFTLKSGRQSPYFFNAGLFYSASLLRSISTAFAQTLVHHVSLNPGFEFDVLFGPRLPFLAWPSIVIAQDVLAAAPENVHFFHLCIFDEGSNSSHPSYPLLCFDYSVHFDNDAFRRHTRMFGISRSPSPISGTADFELVQAYKGIPLATATVDKLADLDDAKFGHVSYSFNRKESKDHGEGGVIVGAPLQGKRVVIVDDVITAGTAMKEAIGIIRGQGGTLVGVVIALDRMERMNDEGCGSAIGEVQREYGVPVLSIINLNDLIGVLGEAGDEEQMLRVEGYKRKYGASD